MSWVGHKPVDTVQRSHKKERRNEGMNQGDKRGTQCPDSGSDGEVGVCGSLTRNITY